MIRKKVIVLILFFLPLMISGCIVGSYPEEDSLSLSPSDGQMFLVTAAKPIFPSNSSIHYDWFIDGVLKTDNPSMYYSPAVSDVGNTVSIICNVIITDDKYDTIISSENRKWEVTVIP
jgi:hypothetical protein